MLLLAIRDYDNVLWCELTDGTPTASKASAHFHGLAQLMFTESISFETDLLISVHDLHEPSVPAARDPRAMLERDCRFDPHELSDFDLWSVNQFPPTAGST